MFKALSSYFCRFLISILSLLLLLISSISKKMGDVVVTVKDRVSFGINDNEVDKANLGLKIGLFVADRFCFIKAFFHSFSPTALSEFFL